MIRRINPDSPGETQLVAARMRLTLIEVLGEERGTAMYSMAWLVDRLRFHLEGERAVFVAEIANEIVGHTIVRVEQEESGTFGLFSTTYVTPEHRRGGVAKALLDRGEAWMRERSLAWAATYTSGTNEKLIRLYQGRGYQIDRREGEMVRLRGEL